MALNDILNASVFQPITINNIHSVIAITRQYAPQDCEFSIGTIFSWKSIQKTHFAIIDNQLIMRICIDGMMTYTFPVGERVTSSAFEAIETDAHLFNQPVRIQGEYSLLQRYFDANYTITQYRNFYNYIYLRNDLINLKGGRYQSKRNHINRFQNTYNYTFQPLTPELIPDCIALEEEWRKQHVCEEQTSYEQEKMALVTALRNYEALELLGGVVFIDGKIEAFSIGSPINGDTFDVMFEKANPLYDGIYSVINQEFASLISEQYTYINREEDLGMEGLRKSKLSYKPTLLFEKSIAEKHE
jgi:hypothetical protein